MIETWFFHYWCDVGNFEFLWYCRVDQQEIEKFREERSEDIDAFLIEQVCWQRIEICLESPV